MHEYLKHELRRRRLIWVIVALLGQAICLALRLVWGWTAFGVLGGAVLIIFVLYLNSVSRESSNASQALELDQSEAPDQI